MSSWLVICLTEGEGYLLARAIGRLFFQSPEFFFERARIIIKYCGQYNILQDNRRNSEIRKQRRLKNDL
jgi:hypothetical protein